MRYRTLGRTGLRVSELALGGAFVSSSAAAFGQARDAIHRALDLGVNYIDTAPMYGNSEEVLGKALRGVKQEFVVSTKLGYVPKPFNPRDKACLQASIEQSLRLLGRDHIDVLMVHEPDRPGLFDWWTDWQDVNGPVLEFMEDLRKKGTVAHIGLGGTTAYELAHLVRSGKFDVMLTAFNYSMLWREAAIETIPAAKEKNVGIVAGSPLQQKTFARRYDEVIAKRPSWLSRPRREQFEKLYAFLDECGMPLTEMAMRFVMSNRDIHCVLMGPRSAQEVEQNVAAAEKGPLPGDVLKRLDEIAATVPFRPMCEPFGIGWVLDKPDGYKGPGGG